MEWCSSGMKEGFSEGLGKGLLGGLMKMDEICLTGGLERDGGDEG